MKKRVISMLLAAIMAVFAVGCGNNQDVAENVVDEDVTEVSDHVQEEDAVEDMEGIPENVTITFWNAWVGSDGDTLTELVHQFNEENEYGITVDMTITSSVNEMLQSSLPTGDAADLILGDTGCINRYVGYLRPIDDIFVSTGLKKEDFLEILRDYLKKGFSEDEVMDILRDYEEYFVDGIIEGKSEIEIIQSLGSPKEIANELLAESNIKSENKVKGKVENFFIEAKGKFLSLIHI